MDTSPEHDPTDGAPAGSTTADSTTPADSGSADRPADASVEGTPGADPVVEPDDAKDPLRFNNWMKRTATGAVMTSIARGFHQALEPPRKESAFVITADDDSDDQDGPIDLRFDPDDPAGTVAIIRQPPVTDVPDVPVSD